ncbi:hypothetical protein C1645_812975 [Glomus cerebriforme]|uniref:Uncharacterized protein n=1 Tax=Glomus cerebriforme TaxID=658196 RepID=A0A397TMW1_9GLOM|nr:hypothetical protein C1645_812975 [Glomus cerebriforme]
MIQHTPQHLSRLQKIFLKRITKNGLLPFLELEKTNSCYSYSDRDVIKNDICLDDIDDNDNDNYQSESYDQFDINEQPKFSQKISVISFPYAITHLNVSTPSSPLSISSCDRGNNNFLSAFGILKSVPSPPDSLFEKINKKRLILFNPPQPKTIILNEQYHINKRKFGGKLINKNDFIIVPTPFIFSRYDNYDYYDNYYEDIETYDHNDDCVCY